MNKKIIIGTLMGCLFGATVGYSASVVSLPHTFTAGTSIKASEVNANFSALAQEIASVKSSLNLNKSPNFTEIAIAPISTAVGSTVTIDSKSFIIKQRSGIDDPITGKKYILNYPLPLAVDDRTAIFATSCKSLLDTEIVVSLGNGNGFTSYVYYRGSSRITSPTSSAAGLAIQVSDSICAFLEPSDSATDMTRATATQMINRATELQKYILVQEA